MDENAPSRQQILPARRPCQPSHRATMASDCALLFPVLSFATFHCRTSPPPPPTGPSPRQSAPSTRYPQTANEASKPLPANVAKALTGDPEGASGCGRPKNEGGIGGGGEKSRCRVRVVPCGAPREGGHAGFVADEEGVEGDGILLRTALRY